MELPGIPRRSILKLGATATGLAAVQGAAPPWAGTASATLAGGITPGKVTAALSELDRRAHGAISMREVPGMAIAVVFEDRVVYAKGFGVRVAGEAAPVDPDTVFQLASVSKPLGSTVIAGLVSDGVVKWDDRIVDHDPGFQMHDPYVTAAVTIRDVYSHRSGLPDHAGDSLEDMGFGREEVLRRLRLIPTNNNFRSHYAYTNFGLTEGAVAAARAAGKSWEEVSEARLYKRLGMNVTSSRLADFLARANRARNHVLIDGRWVAKYQRRPDAQSPAGGASSSVHDMARWMRLHLNCGRFDGETIIAAQALAQTYRPHMVSDSLTKPAAERYGFYGLGWGVSYDELGRVRLSHSGAFMLGAATTVVLLPADKLGIAALTNAAPRGVPESLTQTFLDLATYGRVQRDWAAAYRPLFEALDKEGRSPIDYSHAPASPRPPLANAAYAGAYQNDYYGQMDISTKGQQLVMTLGRNARAYSLAPYDRDVFFYDTAGENAVGLSGVTFTIGADGKAERVVVENLTREGWGTFYRAAGH